MKKRILLLFPLSCIILFSCGESGNNTSNNQKQNIPATALTDTTKNNIISDTATKTSTSDNYESVANMFVSCERTALYTDSTMRKVLLNINPGDSLFINGDNDPLLLRMFLPDSILQISTIKNGKTYEGWIHGTKVGIGYPMISYGKKIIIACRYKEYKRPGEYGELENKKAEILLIENGKPLSNIQLKYNYYLSLFKFKNETFPKPIKLFMLSEGMEACGYNDDETLFYLDSFTLHKICTNTSYEDAGVVSNKYAYILPGEPGGRPNELKEIFKHSEDNEKGQANPKADSTSETVYLFNGKRFIKK